MTFTEEQLINIMMKQHCANLRDARDIARRYLNNGETYAPRIDGMDSIQFIEEHVIPQNFRESMKNCIKSAYDLIKMQGNVLIKKKDGDHAVFPKEILDAGEKIDAAVMTLEDLLQVEEDDARMCLFSWADCQTRQ